MIRIASLLILLLTLVSSARAAAPAGSPPSLGPATYEVTDAAGDPISTMGDLVIAVAPVGGQRGNFRVDVWLVVDNVAIWLEDESGYAANNGSGYTMLTEGGSLLDITLEPDGRWKSVVLQGQNPGHTSYWS
ncbi:MAG: hypothetical protein ACE37K_10620 [Planctomycetota bacterium]